MRFAYLLSSFEQRLLSVMGGFEGSATHLEGQMEADKEGEKTAQEETGA